MCLVTFMKDMDPEYPLIFVANRDEMYDRPAVPIHRWVENPQVTAGVDLKAGGTWLGYTKQGKFIAVLNYPFTNWTPATEKPRSRGQLLKDYLTKDISIADFEDYLQKNRKEYNGYHLIFGDLNELKYYSNVTDDLYKFGEGLHVLSNTTDDLSKHRKQHSGELLKKYVKTNHNHLTLDKMIEIMQDRQPAERMEDYPKVLDKVTAKQNSSIFIQGNEFGTVGTTAILLNEKGEIHVREVKYNRKKITEETTLKQQLNI